jgi:ABC-type Fe3+/spermidine/putrescine transport system ATPase subunit
VLRIADLAFSFGRHLVLDGITSELEEGQLMTILGPSGCGKTTLLNCIAGFLTPTAGRIEFDGVDITGWAPEMRGFGVVFQEYALFPHMTVFENVAFGLRARRQPAAAIQARVAELLELVDLPGLERRYPTQLSGGQRQRVALARAIAPRPKLLLLDEPLTALDRSLRVQLQEEIRRLHRVLRLTMVMVTHDPEEAMSLSDHIMLLQAGKVVQTGSPRGIYESPNSRVAASYLGRLNEFSGTIARSARESLIVKLDASGVELQTLKIAANTALGDSVRLLMRPESLQLCAAHPRHVTDPAHEGLAGTLDGAVGEIVHKGAVVEVWVKTLEGPVVVATSPGNAVLGTLAAGDVVCVAIPLSAIHCFRAD